ncbi:uncharacterized protein LOC132619177 isoform X2 [Lycium barbarum]|uniref:uncharacterized protein LOC132619177 isoform X2 n=1 Tax=Lycium barbarum TaxID=112863 RepID=UPI00293F5B7E|nr:uncharacterized protein LOC132619177 isoform X2 [Lycium barbarum]
MEVNLVQVIGSVFFVAWFKTLHARIRPRQLQQLYQDIHGYINNIAGVENVSIEAANNLLTVIGVGIDTVELVNILRKKVGFATVVSVGPADEKKNEDKPADDKKEQPVPGVYCCNNNQVRPMVEVFEIRDSYYYNNSCYPW